MLVVAKSKGSDVVLKGKRFGGEGDGSDNGKENEVSGSRGEDVG